MDEVPNEAHSERMELGRAVAAALAAGDVTQKRVAELTGIPQGRLSAIINNYRNERVTIEEAVRIEDALELPRGYILGFAGVVTGEGAARGEEAAARAARDV